MLTFAIFSHQFRWSLSARVFYTELGALLEARRPGEELTLGLRLILHPVEILPRLWHADFVKQSLRVRDS